MKYVVLVVVAACGRFGFSEPPAADAPIARADAHPALIADAAADAALPVAYAQFTMDGDPSQGIVANDPAYTGACTLCPTSVAGHLGNAIYFDATTAVTMSFTVGAQPYTIAVWFSTATQGSLLAKPYDLVSQDNVLNIATGMDGSVTYETFDGTAPNYLRASATSVFGAWHHVAITWDGATKALYLDGTLQGTATVAALDAEQPLRLGTDTDMGASAVQYTGALDELRFYDRALDATEVAQIAQ